jgi:[ribosomal protein S5]-alanine N-acetyltransferase
VKLETRRLTLQACSLRLAEALLDGEGSEAIAEAALPADWPDTELTGLLPLYVAQLRRDPATLGFGVWLAIEHAPRVVAGSAGFVGPPQEGAVELGYGIHPDFRNRGYASEAAEALVRWALEQPTVRKVVSECERTNAASVRVLEKAGLRRTGERGTVITWSTV